MSKPKKKGKDQLYFDTEWTQDRIEENGLDLGRDNLARFGPLGLAGDEGRVPLVRDRFLEVMGNEEDADLLALDELVERGLHPFDARVLLNEVEPLDRETVEGERDPRRAGAASTKGLLG